MATDILRPQDCLIERPRFSPCRRRNFHHAPSPTPSSSSSNVNSNPNPRFNKKPAAVRSSERLRHQEQSSSVSRRSSSPVEDIRLSRHGNNHKSLDMEKITILRRGRSLDSEIKSSEGDLVVTDTSRLGPEPEMVSKQIRLVHVRSPVVGMSEVYAGWGFAVSPEPSSLPLPSFSKKNKLIVDDSATRDLRRLLRLDL